MDPSDLVTLVRVSLTCDHHTTCARSVGHEPRGPNSQPVRPETSRPPTQDDVTSGGVGSLLRLFQWLFERVGSMVDCSAKPADEVEELSHDVMIMIMMMMMMLMMMITFRPAAALHVPIQIASWPSSQHTVGRRAKSNKTNQESCRKQEQTSLTVRRASDSRHSFSETQ